VRRVKVSPSSAKVPVSAHQGQSVAKMAVIRPKYQYIPSSSEPKSPKSELHQSQTVRGAGRNVRLQLDISHPQFMFRTRIYRPWKGPPPPIPLHHRRSVLPIKTSYLANEFSPFARYRPWTGFCFFFFRIFVSGSAKIYSLLLPQERSAPAPAPLQYNVRKGKYLAARGIYFVAFCMWNFGRPGP